MSNCAGNTSRGHRFSMIPYGGAIADVPTVRLTPSRWGLRLEPETVRDDGIGETLWEVKGDEVLVAEMISGAISINPRPIQLQAICRAIFGGAAFAGNTKLPGDICDYFHLRHYDPNLNRAYRFNNCVTSQATFSAQERGLLNLNWGVTAGARAIITSSAADEVPASLLYPTSQPFAFRSGTLTIASRTFRMKQFSLTVDNDLQMDFFNQLTPTDRPVGMQTFTLTHDSPWDSIDDVAMLGSAQEAAATLNFVRGTEQLQFEFPSLFTYVPDPEVAARQRVMNTFSWRAKFDPAHAIAAPVRITAVQS